MRIVPAPDRLVRDPETSRLVDPTDGLMVDPTNLYWARMLADGDVVEAPDANELQPGAAAPAKER